MGVAKALARISENFIWTWIRKDVERFVATCVDCQHTKYETRKAARLLGPLHVPSWPWKDLSLDFIVGLPSYRGHNTILVVVDRFPKGIHLSMLPPHHTSLTVVLLFMEIMGKLHGMPKSLILDRDSLFISRFWQELFRISGTKLCMSSAYHPQFDGQTALSNNTFVPSITRDPLHGESSWIGQSDLIIRPNIQALIFLHTSSLLARNPSPFRSMMLEHPMRRSLMIFCLVGKQCLQNLERSLWRPRKIWNDM